jgi:hypothetical protein
MTSTKMAITKVHADEIAQALLKWNKGLNVSVREPGNEVVATAKTIKLNALGLAQLTGIVGGYDVSFGRSGANFRMIISKS